MVIISEKSTCMGCSACSQSCPQGCITMTADSEGFLYPVVDEKSCIRCGKCTDVCPYGQPDPGESNLQKAFGAMAKNLPLRMSSSSGGVFSVLAGQWIAAGGVVYGAALTEDCKAVNHIAVDTIESLDKLRGSKYVQSRIGSAYSDIKATLDEKKKVLFSGTPCQIAGLRSYLGKEYENLLCVGVICHGVPSPAAWSQYVELLSRKKASAVKEVSFRDKKNGWSDFGLRIAFEDGRELYRAAWKEPYMRMFLHNLSLRPSCYHCTFKGNRSGADMLLGDFWGVESVDPRMDDHYGASLILTFNRKAEEALSLLQDELVCYEEDFKKAVSGNSTYVRAVSCPAQREAFFGKFEQVTFSELAAEFVPIKPKERLIHLLSRLHLLEAACKVLRK